MKPSFDKYHYYRRSVQDPEQEVQFILKAYAELNGGYPSVVREDFCGMSAIAARWVQRNKANIAHGVDLDPEPLAYGRANILPTLDPDQLRRIYLHHKDVLDADLPSADVIGAMNFSYFIFKKRRQLLGYFENCLRSLHPNGLLVLDCLGGSQTQDLLEEETEHDGFSYFWDLKKFDPVNNNAHYAIHFKPDGGRKVRDCFEYDWRMWSIPEVRECLEDAGFRDTFVYWEGTDDEGDGDGVFTRTEEGEECETWIAYIVGRR